MGLDAEDAYRVRTLLALCENHLIDAGLALSMFEVARTRLIAAHSDVTNDGRKTVEVPGVGNLPPNYLHRLPFVHAHTVLYALDGISRALQRLSLTTGASSGVSFAAHQFENHFPSLKHVRDSSHHLEDRAHGLDRRRSALDLKPIKDGPIQSPTGGILALDNLEDDNLCFTGDNGHYYPVSISSESVRKAQEGVQEAINNFDWEGPLQFLP